MANRIKVGDKVKVIAGGHKGKTGDVVAVSVDQVFIDGVNVRTRHVAPSRINPQGGKKDIHVGIDISNVALIVGEDDKTSKIGWKVNKDGEKVRFAKTNGKEMK